MASRRRLPRLATLASTIVDLATSEACVERIFSKMKVGITKMRTRIRHENMEAQIVVNSAVHLSNTVEKQIDVDTADRSGNPLPPLPSVSTITVTWILVHAEPPPPPQQAGRRRTRNADEICAMCERFFDHHPEPQSAQCDLCERWFALTCVGIPVGMRTVIQNSASWKCPKCQEL